MFFRDLMALKGIFDGTYGFYFLGSREFYFDGPNDSGTGLYI